MWSHEEAAFCRALSASEQELELNAQTPLRVRLRFGVDHIVEDLRLQVDGSQLTISASGRTMSVDATIQVAKADDGEVVEDLILAAHGDARSKLETATAEKMKALTGGLPLPPGLNLGL